MAASVSIDRIELGERSLVPSLFAITPEDFGAVGDGVSDDTAALLLWAAAAAPATLAVPLRLAARRKYLFSSKLLFAPSGSNGKAVFDFEGSSFTWNGTAGVSATASFTFSTADTITRASGSFVTDGFVANEWIEIEGAPLNTGTASSTSSGFRSVYVTAVSALTLTIASAETLVNETVSCTLRQHRICMQWGSSVTPGKWNDTVIRGLRLTGSIKANTVGVKWAHGDFGVMDSCEVSVGSRQFYVPGSLERGSANGLSWRMVRATAGTTGALIQSNNFGWSGGKVQQCTGGVVFIESTCVSFNESVDFSIITEYGIKFIRTGDAFVRAYFEQMGTETRGDTAKLVHGIASRGIAVVGCHLNCSNGTANAGTHCGYGVYLEACDAWSIRDCAGKLPQRALVYTDANCKRIVLEPTMTIESLTSANLDTVGPVVDLSGRLINRAKGAALTPPPLVPANASNLINPDISTWTAANGAVLTATEVTDGDGDGVARVLELPTVSGTTSNIVRTGTLTSGASSRTVYLRIRLRLVAFRVAAAASRTTDLAAIRLFIIDTGNISNQVNALYRIGDQWDWYELRYANPPQDAAFQAKLEVRVSQEPIDIAIDGVEMFAA